MNNSPDGDGNRVQKSNGKIYWYGAGTEILEETDATGSMTNASFSEYIYFAGKRVARHDGSGNVFYYAQDALGTTDGMVEITANNATETFCYDADFYPFGAEKVYTNTCPQNYKFEGKERDAESGNDDFGARYYSSVYARWLSPDWSSVPAPVPYANLNNPQTLNLYAMVADNPETFADLDGHCERGARGGCNNEDKVPNEQAPPQPPQLPPPQNSVGQVVKDTVLGAGKEAANTVIGLANLVNAPIDWALSKLGVDFSFGQGTELQASTPGEKGAMIGTGLALLFIPGGEAAKAGETLTRFGTGVESAEKLGAQAALAEEKIGIHGVSVTGRPNPNTPGSTALRSQVEKLFTVHDTTGENVYHRTVELAKPVTQAVADAFNRVFGRIP